jgi:hypothetical protein
MAWLLAVLLVMAAMFAPCRAALSQTGGDVFSSSGAICGTPGHPMDMSKIYSAVNQYPHGRLVYLSPQQEQQYRRQLASQPMTPGGPIWELAPCFGCTQQYGACIVYWDRTWGYPQGDAFSSTNLPGDVYSSQGLPPGVPGGGDVFSSICKKSPQSYTCLYGHPNQPPPASAFLPPYTPGPGNGNPPPPGIGPLAPIKEDTKCYDPPDQHGRFGVANINEADPYLLVTSRIIQGWDDCAKQNAAASLLLYPITYLIQRYRFLKTIMMIYGYGGTAAELVQDINALRQPGQTLGDVSYYVGRMLCQGYTLKDILSKTAKFPKQKPPSKETTIPKPPKGPRNGITPLDDAVLQRFVRDNQIILIVRNSNPYALRWIGYPKAVPKPMALKAKSLKPPENSADMTPAQLAEEGLYAPYYGLASARGLSAAERQKVLNAGFFIRAKCNGEIIVTRDGGYIYSDVDLHGAYDLKGNWVGSNALLKSLNNTTTDRFFQHGAQDDFFGRNTPGSGSFGPQPPVTVYFPGGRSELTTIKQMEDFYLQNGIKWGDIYPLPIGAYGKP